jgi:IS605 OrfB family transposase
MKTQTKTLKIRVKDKHSKMLGRLAFGVNQVWNATNDLTHEAYYVPVPEIGYIKGVWLSGYDAQKIILPINKERALGLPSHTVQQVVAEHASRRKQFKKSKLKWRTSGGSRKSLGWIPFKKGQLKYRQGQVGFAGNFIRIWDSYGLSKYDFRSGSFSEDSRGRWYLNIVVEVPVEQSKGKGQIGIDLGLKTTAVCSDGTEFERKEYYRKSENKLATAQSANKKSHVRSLHAKIKNQRADAIHKFTTKLIEENELIVIGGVSSKALARTKMAKSVLDAGWGMLKTQLDYKSKRMLVEYIEVNEAYTTQTCSYCGLIGRNSPKGRAGLEIREWKCSECGATHDRDINAAKNILRLGHQTLAGGISVL